MKVYIDFKCPYTNRFHAFVGLVREEKDVQLEWSSFSLDEQNRATDQPIWEQDDLATNPSLLTMAGLEEIKQRDPDAVEAYVDAAFLAWHSKDSSPELPQIQALLSEHDIVVSDRHFKAVQASHEQARALKAFGSPSLVVNDEAAPVFIKLDHVPQQPADSWQTILTMAKDDAIIELKQPS